MAPKKKGKGDKKGKKGKEKGDKGGKAPLGEGEEVSEASATASAAKRALTSLLSCSQMSEEQLKETISLLRSELEHEREERNYFQLERDKINTFWEITKKVRATLPGARQRKPPGGERGANAHPPPSAPLARFAGAGGSQGRASQQGSGDGGAGGASPG